MEIGTTIGAYQIIAKLGEGGMGEVYRARDPRLQRDVAIKVLPAAVASDAERLARFTREAQLLASLNHPHIAHVYGVEQDSTTRALVMELVDGPTLADRIAGSAIPLDEALPIARQIAEALDAAHERGIIHRDLKPANIKLTADATVKVLDFGLAKALGTGEASGPGRSGGEEPLNAPTITTPAMTQAGVILGTAAYMSPEQARGKPVDKRADIWAFGVVLYEMLTGRPLFGGETVSDTIAEVLKHAHVSDWSPDGRWLLVDLVTPGSGLQLVDLKDPQTTAKPFQQTSFSQSNARVSPNGLWMTYMSNESGRNEIYVQSFPQAGNKIRVSTGGGITPIWSRDGSRLFYRSQTLLMAVTVSYQPELSISVPQPLMADNYGRPLGDTHTSFDVTPEGDFVFTRSAASIIKPRVLGVLNWAQGLR